MRVDTNPSPVEHRMPLCPRRRRQVCTGLAQGLPLHDNICGTRRRVSLPLNGTKIRETVYHDNRQRLVPPLHRSLDDNTHSS